MLKYNFWRFFWILFPRYRDRNDQIPDIAVLRRPQFIRVPATMYGNCKIPKYYFKIWGFCVQVHSTYWVNRPTEVRRENCRKITSVQWSPENEKPKPSNLACGFQFQNFLQKTPSSLTDGFEKLTRLQGMNQSACRVLYHVTKDYITWSWCWYYEKILFNCIFIALVRNIPPMICVNKSLKQI